MAAPTRLSATGDLLRPAGQAAQAGPPVLKPGGEVLIVEATAGTLDTLTRPLERAFADDPLLLTARIRITLPRSAQAVARWFRKVRLSVTHTSTGSQLLPVTTPDAALEWVRPSALDSGFRNAVDVSREIEVRQRLSADLDAHMARAGNLKLHHNFVVVAGITPG